MDRDISIGRVFLWTALVLAGLYAFAAVGWGIGVAGAGLFGRGEARKQIEGRDNRIQSQEVFHQRLANIRGYDDQIGVQTETLMAAEADQSPEGRAEVIRLRAVVSGLRNQCLQARADYDAETRKISKERFRDADLPATIAEAYPAPEYDCVAG